MNLKLKRKVKKIIRLIALAILEELEEEICIIKNKKLK
jgi:hypothetical protein